MGNLITPQSIRPTATRSALSVGKKAVPLTPSPEQNPGDVVELNPIGVEKNESTKISPDTQAKLGATAAAAATSGPAGLTTAYCSTYSIVARCPETGRLGVAVESHWFDVRNTVAWVQPGVGAVATQAATNQAFGPRGLALMKAGKSPNEALAVMETEDPVFARRQGGWWTPRGEFPDTPESSVWVTLRVLRGRATWPNLI